MIARILALRREAAQLLGYPEFRRALARAEDGERRATRCSRSCAISRAARSPTPSATTPSSTAFARDELGLARLEPWDVAYASEKLKATRYAFSEQEVRPYFPEDNVLAGLFRVAETLYGISIREASAPTWHPDVRFFDITDAAGALIGQFYLDIYARPGKQGGAWMDDAINRRRAGAQRAASGRLSHVQPLGARRRRRRGSRRRSRTTRSSRCSTNSATACTSC